MSKELLFFYQERAEGFAKDKKKLSNLLSYTSLIRLVLFALFGWFLYSAFAFRFQGYHLLISLFALLAFFVIVFFTGEVKKKINFLNQLIRINENELNILDGQPSFLANGADFFTSKGFTTDLPIFGNHSLFHLLNRVGSVSGKEQLKNRLVRPLETYLHILEYQESVKELSEKIDFRQTLLANTILLINEEGLPLLKATIPVDLFSELNHRIWSILSLVWPFGAILLIIYSVYFDNYQNLLLFGIAGLLLMSFLFKKTSQLYYHISKKSYLFGQYARCFQLIANELFTTPLLVQKQKEIIDAAAAFKKLETIGTVYDLRMSIFSFFINGLFLFELLCARSYLRWNARWQSKIENWFKTIGEVEMLNSLAAFHFNHPSYIFPECSKDGLIIDAKGMGHPLMKIEQVIVNDFTIGAQSLLHIITGSNMSGKSTFLRTLGLNMVLAQIGVPVFAEKFVFRPARILTSFHHIDSLEENSSYFYTELKALHEIILSLENQMPALVLLDEVMRGTNSKDKHDGTALLIKKLLQFNCMTLIATHDTDLGILAASYSGAIENFCFESELSDNTLSFDFKIRRGVAQSKNATFLMKKMGII